MRLVGFICKTDVLFVLVSREYTSFSQLVFYCCVCGSNMAASAKCLTGATCEFRKQIRSMADCRTYQSINPLNPELNPICYLLPLLAHHFLHVSRIRVKSLTLRLLMSCIYGAPILDVSRSHTTTQHSR